MNQLQYVRDKLSQFRRIEYLLSKPEFVDIIVPLELIDRCDTEAIQGYLKRYAGVETLTLSELRDRAAILRISPIWGQSRSQLILAILEKLDEAQPQHLKENTQ